MFIKERIESDELKILRILNIRGELTRDEKYRLSNLEKGFKGEVEFDLLTKTLQEERYILNDLLLKVKEQTFQIDSVIISHGVVYLFDVKNYEDNCYIDGDLLCSADSDSEYSNPVNQLKRASSLFRQLLQKNYYNILVKAYVVFINPEFTLYQAPRDQPIILPTQVKRFIETLNKTSSKLDSEEKMLAKLLLAHHQTKNPFTNLPIFSFGKLKKGPFCCDCHSFDVNVHKHNLVCKKCEKHEKVSSTVLRCVNEIKLLFPEMKITTVCVYDWCGSIIGKKRIRRILLKNFQSCGGKNHTYYELL